MLYSSGAVADIVALPAPVNEKITVDPNQNEYYVKKNSSDPAILSAKIEYSNNLSLYGNIANDDASGAVNGKTFTINSTFTNQSSERYILKLYAGYSVGNKDVTHTQDLITN